MGGKESKKWTLEEEEEEEAKDEQKEGRYTSGGNVLRVPIRYVRHLPCM